MFITKSVIFFTKAFPHDMLNQKEQILDHSSKKSLKIALLMLWERQLKKGPPLNLEKLWKYCELQAIPM